MKNVLVLLFIITNLFAVNTKEMLRMIRILKHTNFQYRPIDNIYNPFVQQTKSTPLHLQEVKIENTQQSETIYNLEVIFQNRVKINNNWYKNGDKIDGYTIVIKKGKVYLKKRNKIINLNKRKSLLKVN